MSQEIPLDNCLVAVGDIMLGDSAICVGFGVHSRYPRDIGPALARVASHLKSGEVVLGNLECLLTRAGRGSTRYDADQMRGDPEYAAGLRDAGFTALAVANNHAMQHGLKAFEETVGWLERAGIAVVGLRGQEGWCASPVIQVTRAGLRVGLLGYSWRPRQYDYSTPPYAEGDPQMVEHDVRRLAAETDVVVVSLHWGEEFLGSPSVSEVDAARRVIDAGASLVVGHHPHVVRPAERYGSGVICYSLGNLVSDMVWQPELRKGAILLSRLTRGAVPESSLARTRIDESYAPVIEAINPIERSDPVIGMRELQYQVAVGQSVRRQRRAAYRHAIRNLRRYPVEVLAELVATTLRNKLSALGSMIRNSEPRTRAAAPASPPRTDSRQPLSILHIAAPAAFGGLETVVRELAIGHAQRGHLVRVALVISPGDASHPFAQSLEGHNVEVITLYMGDRDYRGERRAIRALCKGQPPDIVHTHGYRCDVVDGGVARAQGIRTVSTCHGFIESDWRGRVSQWLQRRALKRFDAVVAVSRAMEEKLREAGVDPAKIHVVLNAVAAKSAIPRDDARRQLDLTGGFVVGWVGRLSHEKGPDLALEAFARLERTDARLVILGDGRDAPALRARAAALGISDRVSWRSPVPDAGRLFRAFDAFLLSSRTEGTPMALLEAMAAEVPIVATRVGGVPAVIDASTGHVVESGDTDAMASALSDILRDPNAARDRTRLAALRIKERFALEPWLTAYESIYRRLLGAR